MPGKEWTATETAYLRDHSEYEDDITIARALRRTVNSVRGKRRRIVDKHVHRWTDDEVSFLVENYPTMHNSDIARRLILTKSAVYAKAKKIGLRKPEGFNISMAKERGRLISRSYEISGEPNSTVFRKGNHNGKPYEKGRAVPKDEIEKRLATLKRTREREKIRDKYGLPRLTKLRI